jgi:hypothetical protein
MTDQTAARVIRKPGQPMKALGSSTPRGRPQITPICTAVGLLELDPATKCNAGSVRAKLRGPAFPRSGLTGLLEASVSRWLRFFICVLPRRGTATSCPSWRAICGINGCPVDNLWL